MGNKTYCFNLLMRKLFGSGAKLKPEDTCGKERERKEWVQGRSKSSYPPSMGGSKVPPAATDKVLERTLSEAEEEHNKHAMAVAIATAAAAEAAVAAAQAAARVVRLTGKGGSYHQMDFTRKESAAIRIQSAFRGYLARKALRALKGLVKLQALVRGHMVRRHAESAFRSMQALHRVQSQVCSRRVTMAEDKKTCEHKLHVQRHAEAVREIDGSNTRRRDDSQLPVGQPGRSLFSGEATFKRERTREHYLDCRDKRAARTPTSSTSSVKQCNSNTKNIERSWIERWLEAQSHRRGSETSSASSVDQNSFSERQIAEAKICLDALFREQEVQSKLNIREGQGRRRLMRSQSPVTNRQKLAQRVMIRDDQSYASSTTSLPSYMVYTESSKAKARSNSTPRQRVSTSSMDKNSFPCVNSNIMVLKRSSSSQQKSPGLKSQPGPVKSDRIIRPIRDLGVNLDQSLVNWDHQRAFR